MRLLMISGDRSLATGKRGAFFATLEELSKHWERIDIICPRVSQRGEQAFPNVFLHPSLWALFLQPWWILKKGKELIAEHHQDVMTVHEYPPFYNGLGAWLLHRATKIPYALEIHHVVGYPNAASCTELIGRWMTRLFIRFDVQRASVVRTVNREVAELLVRWGVPREKIQVRASMYLDHEALKQAAYEKVYDVVAAGRMVANKGFSELLEAMAMLPGVRLHLIGDGPLRPPLESQCNALKISTRVTFAGWLPSPRNVYAALQQAKIVVMNSKSEGGPRIAVEAMALGMPLITTRVGLMPEIVRDRENAIFTDGTPKDLAAKIDFLLHHENERKEMGERAKGVLQLFERKKLVREYAECLKNLSTPHPNPLPQGEGKIRLLFITQKIHGQDAFGLLWAKAFVERGYEVIILCLEARPEEAVTVLGSALPSVKIVSMGKEKRFGKLRQILIFWKYIASLQYDRVFIHMSPVWGLLGAWLWIPQRIPVYLWYTHYKMQAGLRLLGLYGKRLFCATEQSLPHYARSPKKIVTGHGIDLQYWPKRPNTCTNPKNLLMVHRLCRSKRIELVLEAMKLLPTDFTLQIYGIEAEPDYVAQMTAKAEQLGLNARVTFHGTVPTKELPAIYISHRLILNMASETIDKTMCEAMTCGCYPVTTARNAAALGIPEAPSEDTPEAIAAFVEKYHTKAPMDAEAMYRVIEERHSLKKLVKKMDAYIRTGT